MRAFYYRVLQHIIDTTMIIDVKAKNSVSNIKKISKLSSKEGDVLIIQGVKKW